jgi:hypothetical protein
MRIIYATMANQLDSAVFDIANPTDSERARDLPDEAARLGALLEERQQQIDEGRLISLRLRMHRMGLPFTGDEDGDTLAARIRERQIRDLALFADADAGTIFFTKVRRGIAGALLSSPDSPVNQAPQSGFDNKR